MTVRKNSHCNLSPVSLCNAFLTTILQMLSRTDSLRLLLMMEMLRHSILDHDV